MITAIMTAILIAAMTVIMIATMAMALATSDMVVAGIATYIIPDTAFSCLTGLVAAST